MLLRPTKLYEGYFLELNKGQIHTDHKNFSIKKIYGKTKKYLPSICKDLKTLNCLILKKLTSSTKKSPLIVGKIEISNQFFKYLSSNYLIKNRFVDGSKIISDHALLTRRYFNENDFCAIYIDQNGQTSFKIRLAKPRKFNVFINSNLENKEFFLKEHLHFRFCVDDGKDFKF